MTLSIIIDGVFGIHLTWKPGKRYSHAINVSFYKLLILDPTKTHGIESAIVRLHPINSTRDQNQQQFQFKGHRPSLQRKHIQRKNIIRVNQSVTNDSNFPYPNTFFLVSPIIKWQKPPNPTKLSSLSKCFGAYAAASFSFARRWLLQLTLVVVPEYYYVRLSQSTWMSPQDVNLSTRREQIEGRKFDSWGWVGAMPPSPFNPPLPHVWIEIRNPLFARNFYLMIWILKN